MGRRHLLIATAIGEGATGLALLVSPSIVLWLLLGVEYVSQEAILASRIAGAALAAIGTACWVARDEQGGAALRGLLIGALLYDVAAAALLAYGGAILKLVGMALWPAVVVHVGLAAWCFVSLRGMQNREPFGTDRAQRNVGPPLGG
jgi:hypothetical protein